MKVSIFGLGWYGLPLAKSLAKKGFEVDGSSTSGKKNVEGVREIKCKYPELPPEIDSDILVLNIPPFDDQLNWFKSWKISPATWVIFISSTSVLSKQSEILAKEEDWIKTLPQWTILRFGGLLGDQRHPGKHMSGKKNLQGRLWPVNLLELSDAVGFTEKVIEGNLKFKIFDVFSSDHPTREEYYTSYCRQNNLPLPHFDQSDVSSKAPLDNSEASKYYSFLPLK